MKPAPPESGALKGPTQSQFGLLPLVLKQFTKAPDVEPLQLVEALGHLQGAEGQTADAAELAVGATNEEMIGNAIIEEKPIFLITSRLDNPLYESSI